MEILIEIMLLGFVFIGCFAVLIGIIEQIEYRKWQRRRH